MEQYEPRRDIGMEEYQRKRERDDKVVTGLLLGAMIAGSIFVLADYASRSRNSQLESKKRNCVEMAPKNLLERIAQEDSMRFKPVEVRNSVDNLDYKIKTGEYTIGN